VTGRFDHDAEVLRQQEFSRLSAGIVPTLDSLRFLNPSQLRMRVAGMLERLGYEMLTPETAADFQAMKDGLKYVVAFASTSDPLPVQANHLTRLHQAIVTNNAGGGFYITTRGFSRDAEAYAATAPIKLVDGPKLVQKHIAEPTERLLARIEIIGPFQNAVVALADRDLAALVGSEPRLARFEPGILSAV
jgi:restriction endonuclease Mrr